MRTEVNVARGKAGEGPIPAPQCVPPSFSIPSVTGLGNRQRQDCKRNFTVYKISNEIVECKPRVYLFRDVVGEVGGGEAESHLSLGWKGEMLEETASQGPPNSLS